MPISKKKKPRRKPPAEIVAKREAAKKRIRDAEKAARKAGRPSRPAPEASWAKASPIRNTNVDMTDHGRCTGCGSCCPSILPVTEEEKAALKAYADEHGLAPELPALPEAILYMQCPFLDQEDSHCLAYPVRPAVCQVYKCDKTPQEAAKDYLELTGRDSTPEPFNLWELFGRTGLRTAEGEITPENANRAELIDETGARFPAQVGRPMDLVLDDGICYPHAMCLDLDQEAMRIFHDGRIVEIAYKDIQAMR